MHTDYTVPPVGRITPDAAREYLTAIYGHHCFRCGLKPSEKRPNMDVDHIIPVARGGGNTFGNFQYLCGPCNSWKGTRVYDFRPGPARCHLRDDLPIVPHEERERKRPLRVVPEPVPAPAPAPAKQVFSCSSAHLELQAQAATHKAMAEMWHGQYQRSNDLLSEYAGRCGKQSAQIDELLRSVSRLTYERSIHACFKLRPGDRRKPLGRVEKFLCFVLLIEVLAIVFIYIYHR